MTEEEKLTFIRELNARNKPYQDWLRQVHFVMIAYMMFQSAFIIALFLRLVWLGVIK